MTDAHTITGATIEYSTDGGTTWTPIPEAKVAPVPQTETDYKEATSLDSGGWREWVAGLMDGGEIEVAANYTRAGYQALAALNGTSVDWKTTFDNGDAFEFAGIPQTTPGSDEVGEIRSMTTAIRVSGAVTFTAGA